MTLQFSVLARNAELDALETELGASPVLKIRTGAAPANVATADSGTILATLNLPADAFAAAGSGSKAKSGTWEDLSADNPERPLTSASTSRTGRLASCKGP